VRLIDYLKRSHPSHLMCLYVCIVVGQLHCSLFVAYVLRIHHAKLTRHGRRFIPFVYFCQNGRVWNWQKQKRDLRNFMFPIS